MEEDVVDGVEDLGLAPVHFHQEEGNALDQENSVSEGQKLNGLPLGAQDKSISKKHKKPRAGSDSNGTGHAHQRKKVLDLRETEGDPEMIAQVLEAVGKGKKGQGKKKAIQRNERAKSNAGNGDSEGKQEVDPAGPSDASTKSQSPR